MPGRQPLPAPAAPSSTRACASTCCGSTTIWASAWWSPGLSPSSSPRPRRSMCRSSSPLKWVVMLAPLAFVFFFSFRMHAMSAASAQPCSGPSARVMGLSLASVFLVFTGTSIARTFFITATMFGATSLYGYTTKRDLSKFGSFLIMGLIGVIIASLVNIFLGSSAAAIRDLDHRRARVHRASPPTTRSRSRNNIPKDFGQEANSKLAVFGALSALSELHQHLPAPAQPHGPAGGIIRIHCPKGIDFHGGLSCELRGWMLIGFQPQTCHQLECSLRTDVAAHRFSPPDTIPGSRRALGYRPVQT